MTIKCAGDHVMSGTLAAIMALTAEVSKLHTQIQSSGVNFPVTMLINGEQHIFHSATELEMYWITNILGGDTETAEIMYLNPVTNVWQQYPINDSVSLDTSGVLASLRAMITGQELNIRALEVWAKRLAHTIGQDPDVNLPQDREITVIARPNGARSWSAPTNIIFSGPTDKVTDAVQTLTYAMNLLLYSVENSGWRIEQRLLQLASDADTVFVSPITLRANNTEGNVGWGATDYQFAEDEDGDDLVEWLKGNTLRADKLTDVHIKGTVFITHNGVSTGGLIHCEVGIGHVDGITWVGDEIALASDKQTPNTESFPHLYDKFIDVDITFRMNDAVIDAIPVGDHIAILFNTEGTADTTGFNGHFVGNITARMLPP